jgi:hydrogenase maturation protein HypF
MTGAWSVRVRGVVQGVGFRPFVYRLARAHDLAGWVLNGQDGVEIHVEGDRDRLDAFLRTLTADPPPAATIATVDVTSADPAGLTDFTIRESERRSRPTTRISPDLPVCDRCLHELFDPADPRFEYPYINCTDCGPRYSIMLGLPYDRAATTMSAWAMDPPCAAEYHDPASRRFHAQPVACPACGPHYYLRKGETAVRGGPNVVKEAARLLRNGDILAVKGLGGYHLACDARIEKAVLALRERKYRKEKPFALMVPGLDAARRLAHLTPAAEALLAGPARPIVLAPGRVALAGVAPDTAELGLMLPYTPLHHLLFAAGAPEVLVMTSANRSSEPIAVGDDEAIERLAGLADAFLIGQRPIARRVEDSVARDGPLGPVILRRGRGYAPAAVASLPADRPILAVGADLKNAITLVVDGQAFVSQHIGDLDQFQSFQAFEETVADLLTMYGVSRDNLIVVHDAHPQYHSTGRAMALAAGEHGAVQHHRAHVASVLAERGEWQRRVLGVSLDGTGYGDDGTIWGGEFFLGSVAEGFERVAHLRSAALVGGDAAARHPVQAAAGFLDQVVGLPELADPPFGFSTRYRDAVRLLRHRTRTFATTSTGRLFDAAAALLGFDRAVSYEGQAAIWLEQLARRAGPVEPYRFPFEDGELDFRPLLLALALDRARGRTVEQCARAFQGGVAVGLGQAIGTLCDTHGASIVAASGGVFQNALLLEELVPLVAAAGLELWINHAVPPNDGGISLGQAALAAFGNCEGR